MYILTYCYYTYVYIDAVIVTILQIHVTQPVPGDILVFLTGTSLLVYTICVVYI